MMSSRPLIVTIFPQGEFLFRKLFIHQVSYMLFANISSHTETRNVFRFQN